MYEIDGFLNRFPPSIVCFSMALAINEMIDNGHKQETMSFIEIFSEEKYPLTRNIDMNTFKSVPSVETIFHFMNTIFKVERVS